MADVTLVTFPPSLDCELSRLLLGHYAVSYVERPHALIFSSFATLAMAGTPLFPLVHGPSVRLTSVRAIVDHYEALALPARKLIPADSGGAEVEADWPAFRSTLATHVAVFAYAQLLPHADLMAGPLSRGAPAFEVRAVRSAYFFFSGILSLMLGITAKRSDDALAATRRAVEAVDERLAGGRRYLVGDRISLSDLAFAVAIGPLVLPEGYGGALPPEDAMPAEMRAAIGEMREHPAADLARRIYRDERAGALGRTDGGQR